MDAITVLKQDHRTVRGLFRKFEQAGKRATTEKQRIADQLFNELEIHATLEQEVFYPAVRDAAGGKGRDLVLEALAEHDAVTNLISELKKYTSDDDEYDAKFTVLEENVTHHMDEEEGRMFPYAQKTLDETQLKDLGRQMADRTHELAAPSLIGESILRAKTFMGEAVAAITGPSQETPHRSRTRARKRTPPTTARTVHHRAKGGPAAHGKAVAVQKLARTARAS